MKPEALIRDPVFQLNLLLWMAKEQPGDGYRVKPLFHQLGFQIIYIEQPFRFPDVTARAISQSGLPISAAPEPELLLGRMSDKRGLYFEAKANSFPATDERNSKQARGHLLATGPCFAEVLRPYENALVCYVVPEAKRALMTGCLQTLSTEMANSGFACGPHSTHGLANRESQIVYFWDSTFGDYSGISGNDAVVMQDITDDTDPTPLLLVYSDQDAPNEKMVGFYRKAFLEQILAVLVCDLNLQPTDQPYSVTARDLIVRMTDKVFEYVGRERQKQMIYLVRQILFKRIGSHWAAKPFQPVELATDTLRINFKDNLAKDEFLDWLEDSRRTGFSDELPKPDPQLPLFREKESDAEEPSP